MEWYFDLFGFWLTIAFLSTGIILVLIGFVGAFIAPRKLKEAGFSHMTTLMKQNALKRAIASRKVLRFPGADPGAAEEAESAENYDHWFILSHIAWAALLLGATLITAPYWYTVASVFLSLPHPNPELFVR